MKRARFIIFAVFVLSVHAKELTIPAAWMNKSDQLSHSFTVISADKEMIAANLADQIQHILTAKKLNLEYTPVPDTALVDVVLHYNEDKLTCRNWQIDVKDISAAADKAALMLEKSFYSGMRPAYSTVFRGDDGKYAEYRIPSVIALPSGRIIAFIEARKWHSDQAENDIIARYSDDMGKTWSEQIVVDEQGKSSLNNACAIYIAERDQILVMYQSFPPKTSEASGFSGNDRLKVFTITSNDGGETWNHPKEVTDWIKHPDATIVCSGPGIAIRSTTGPDKGRIVVPLNAIGKKGWFNYLAYSDDLGESWKYTGNHSGYGANESQVVQTDTNRYLINARSHRYPEFDTEETPDGWNPWDFTRVTRSRVNTPVTLEGNRVEWGKTDVQPNQPDPTCQGSILRISGLGIGEKRDRSRILLSNPASQYTVPENKPYANTPPRRLNGTVKISYDEGENWAHSKRIYGNRFTEYQYSVLVNLKDGKIGCLFEAYPEVKFAVFDLEWLTGGEDHLFTSQSKRHRQNKEEENK